MGRREFITLLGGAAATWPVAARAQQAERMRRTGALIPIPVDDPEAKARISAFQQGLDQLGWTVGLNVRIDYRWSTGDATTTREHAVELVALAPDIILAGGTTSMGPLLQATRTVPIVFVTVAEPVGAGFVESLARPGGNVTGFTAQDYGFSGKLLGLLKEVFPGIMRAAVVRDPAITAGIGTFGAIQSMAPSLGVEVSPVNVRDAGEMQRAIAAFAHSSNGGLIVTPSGLAVTHRDLIVTLAARHKLPAIYYARHFLAAGGLAFYGIDIIDQYRRAASYVDRILRGEKPSDLPVQAPTKYALGINLKTANVLGLEIPPTLLARADEVIELKRREFITLLGGAAVAWPLAARAQQAAVPVVGFLNAGSPTAERLNFLAAFRQALIDVGYVEGRSVSIEYCWAENQYGRLPALAADLVRRQVSVIAAPGSTPAALAAKAATKTIPIVFAMGSDPVALGLVASLNRPGSNVTGMSFLISLLVVKQLEQLHELVPNATVIAVLLNPKLEAAASQLKDVQVSARALGLQVHALYASTERDFDTVFASLIQLQAGGLVISADALFFSRLVQFVGLAKRCSIPTVYPWREAVAAGGLVSYVASVTDGYRLAGVYTGRILKGEKPGDPPVQQSTKTELVINLKTMKALGLNIPDRLLAIADEVIE